jgi:hypothetical protein
MNTNLTIRSIFTAVVLGSCVAASALSLGPLAGSAMVGRPLQLSVPVQLDDVAQGNGSGCMTAEVAYGERAVSSTSVRADLSADGKLARISSPIPVDEPFVTVLLHAGCGTQSTRRYVVLAEAPRDAPMVLGAATSLDLASLGAGAVPSVDASRRAAQPDAGPKTPTGRPPSRHAAARAPAREGRRDVAAAPGRLQLALWEPGSEGSPWLRASAELLSIPTADAAHRAAATALWRALNAQPQDLLRTAERLRGLEGEVVSLRGLASRHRSEISSARESLLETRGQHYANLALAMTLALLAGGGAALFWHRSKRAAALAPYASWYPPLEPRLDESPLEEDATARVAVAVLSPAAPADRPAVSPQGVDATGHAAPAPFHGAPVDVGLDFAPGAVVADRPEPTRLKVDALHGAQQQSEFFASLGQYDEAIAVLVGYLDETRDRPVLAYMELFRIYHGLERRTDYGQLQATFREAFGIPFPGIDDYREEHRELELYPVAVSRIAASWPSKGSQDLIEELLFKPPAAARELLSVDAYRELIWLYTLGQDILQSTRLPAGLQLVGGADLLNDHFILPWALNADQGTQELSLDRLDAIDVASQLSGFGVDIDLTAAPAGALHHGRIDDHTANGDVRGKVTALHAAPVVDADEAFDAVMEFHSRKNAG